MVSPPQFCFEEGGFISLIKLFLDKWHTMNHKHLFIIISKWVPFWGVSCTCGWKVSDVFLHEGSAWVFQQAPVLDVTSSISLTHALYAVPIYTKAISGQCWIAVF